MDPMSTKERGVGEGHHSLSWPAPHRDPLSVDTRNRLSAAASHSQALGIHGEACARASTTHGGPQGQCGGEAVLHFSLVTMGWARLETTDKLQVRQEGSHTMIGVKPFSGSEGGRVGSVCHLDYIWLRNTGDDKPVPGSDA